MRTLALLAALVLVTLQAQAGPLQEREEEIPALELPGAEDPDVSISITWGENSVPQAPGERLQHGRAPRSRAEGQETGSGISSAGVYVT
uniref:Alpha-defensin N-terminal domain-containing protein n=1 Tax=Prolemur simus TaxID=1328070 RepID=A0A8C8YK21_PROSS